MARRERTKGKVNIKENIKELLVDIMEAKETSVVSVEEIKNRLSINEVLLTRGKTGAFDSEDAHALEGIISHAVGEYIFSEMSSEEYRDFMKEIIEATKHVQIVESDQKEHSRRKVTSDLDIFLAKFDEYLTINDFAKNPNFTSFTKLTEKFKLKRLCVFPRVESQNQLYAAWEEFTRNR